RVTAPSVAITHTETEARHVKPESRSAGDFEKALEFRTSRIDGFPGGALDSITQPIHHGHYKELCMTTQRESVQRTRSTDQQLTDLLDRALDPPGVRQLLAMYDAAEQVYASTIVEPKIWYSTSSNIR
ncbi:MAG: hypothetical protein ACYDCQ_21105, partial [Dehalococcoidia bacterium]